MSSGAHSFANRRSSSSCVWFGGFHFNSGACGGLRSPLGIRTPPGAPRRGRQRRYVPPAAGRACIFLCSAHGAFCAATSLWPINESTGSEAEAFGRFVSPFFSFLLFFLPSPFSSFFLFSRWLCATWQKSTFWPSFLSPLGQVFRHLFRQPYKRTKAKRTANSCARLLGLTMMPRPPSAQN